MLHKVNVVTPPTEEPLTYAEAAEHLRIVGETDYVNSLIVTARKSLERYLNRTFVTTELKAFADEWDDEFYLPYPKLQSVESVKYYDTNGSLQTLSESDFYWVVTNDDPGYIVQKFDSTFPDLQEGRPDAIEISYTSGYGDAADVPEDIKHALKLLIGNYYENRGDIIVGTSAARIPNYISDLVHSYRIYEF